jgi:serine/threonine protein kinase
MLSAGNDFSSSNSTEVPSVPSVQLQTPPDAPLLGPNASTLGNPGERTLADVDALLARAAIEVQLGMEEGMARIGRYTLVTQVGEGGFGTVWLASQEEPVRRLVALKLLRRDPGSRLVLARFENERHTLARMDHPNVATVLDAGVTDDGRPWFVMPFIDGLPINALCDERRMRPRDRVRLFIDVCEGVQHAHQKGVIHRDLKPGNILVTRSADRAVAKVIDFGVAKAVDPSDAASLRTAEGQRLGTPQYMAPEQWMHGAGIADARSDVYALGTVLAELLVGGPPSKLPRSPLEVPYVVAPIAWLAETATERPAAAVAVAAARGMLPDELTEVVRGDLDAIVRRATAAHPEDRYASAAALADDLKRYLDGLPVAARLLEPWERSWRAVRRHRVATALAVIAVLAIVGGLVQFVLWNAQSKYERQLADTAQRQSDQTFELAKTMIEDMVAQQSLTKDSTAGKAAFARMEQLVDRIAIDDPLTAGRLAAVVVRGHEEAWQHRSAYELLKRSLEGVVKEDPAGQSTAFQELAPIFYRMALKHDRPLAAIMGPVIFSQFATSGKILEAPARSLIPLMCTNGQPWPFFSQSTDPAARIMTAQWYSSLASDPIDAACIYAIGRISTLVRCDDFPNRSAEYFAARAYIEKHLSPNDPQLLLAEAQVCTMMSLDGLNSDDMVHGMMLHCARTEHHFGSGAGRTVNAHWNLAYACANLGHFEDAYLVYKRFLWPEYHRQLPTDGLRPWYLGFFAPIAYRVCDYETAYECAMTQLGDQFSAGGVSQGVVTALSARVLAGVLSAWGDEDGARSVEVQFGIQRLPEGSENW